MKYLSLSQIAVLVTISTVVNSLTISSRILLFPQLANAQDCGVKDGIPLPCWNDFLDSGQGTFDSIEGNESLPLYPYAKRPNGCSLPKTRPGEYDNFASLGYNFSFKEVCNNHDRCYYTLGTRPENCNATFAVGLAEVCRDRATQLPPDPKTFVIEVASAGMSRTNAIKNCYARAKIMSDAVIAAQYASHEEAQDRQKRYLRKVDEYVVEVKQDLRQQGVDLYRTILGRDPEPGAAEGLASRLANGSTLARERQVMANSEESRNNAVNLYRTILGRDPEPGAAEGIVSRLANNSTLARERQIMANSEESRNNLANLYRTILGREPEAGAVDGLVSRLANGSTLAQEREIIANSEEAKRRRGL
ncbi:Group XII secretory phospholipase A2 precursor (PLA2G12) [Allocoleopsis franciscana]|uniref:Group XII secretory phospholipase A2 (PLA2G12) n=1 Tax=Allocoleopsis franciscana PCC 7113 TaxID=1173027 RepID=K9W7Q9_9CYAN|nr:Group XII secretory phospholipase A2 precursor (PLA2G12) [Allocoleopsis franciscana]AFZ16425.1 Group XII secretory phospholipase A2 precursor (PLA2G12) [Allocoleopsis franciscana PCC 7113]